MTNDTRKLNGMMNDTESYMVWNGTNGTKKGKLVCRMIPKFMWYDNWHQKVIMYDRW